MIIVELLNKPHVEEAFPPLQKNSLENEKPPTLSVGGSSINQMKA